MSDQQKDLLLELFSQDSSQSYYRSYKFLSLAATFKFGNQELTFVAWSTITHYKLYGTHLSLFPANQKLNYFLCCWLLQENHSSKLSLNSIL